MKNSAVICKRDGTPYKTRRAAVRNAPWASVVKKVDGGYMAFPSQTDWQIWKRQK